MLDWSLAAFRAAASIGPIVVAAPPGVDELSGSEDEELRVVEGGETRSQSVSNALAAVQTELVAIHDAARPLVTPELVEEVVATLLADPDATGAIAAAPVTDTIKQTGAPRTGHEGPPASSATLPVHNTGNVEFVIERTLDRDELWAAQTPQVFRVEALREALDGTDTAATDEAMLVEAAGGRVLICPAPAANVKVTTQGDLLLAEQLLAQRSAQQ